MLSQQELKKELQDLGPTSVGVRNKLLELDCTGWEEEAGSCPVANYLQYKFGHLVSVEGQMISVGDVEIHGEDIPEAVQQFITDFDEGKYPELSNWRTLE